MRAMSSLASGLPGTMAVAPLSRGRVATLRSSSRRPALRCASSRPWHAWQCSERMGWMSLLKLIFSAPCAGLIQSIRMRNDRRGFPFMAMLGTGLKMRLATGSGALVSGMATKPTPATTEDRTAVADSERARGKREAVKTNKDWMKAFGMLPDDEFSREAWALGETWRATQAKP